MFSTDPKSEVSGGPTLQDPPLPVGMLGSVRPPLVSTTTTRMLTRKLMRKFNKRWTRRRLRCGVTVVSLRKRRRRWLLYCTLEIRCLPRRM